MKKNEKEKYYFKGDFEIIGDTIVSYKGKDSDVTIPDGVTEIDYWTFAWCESLKSIIIPNSVTTIGDWAFYGCSGLTSVTIGDSVKEIGYETFYGCSSLDSITIPERFKDEKTLKHIGFNDKQIYLILNKTLK